MRSQPMVIRAVRLAVFGALVAGIALAAGGQAAPTMAAAESFPVLTASSSTSRKLRFGYRQKPVSPAAV
jgi:hypothetical protein